MVDALARRTGLGGRCQLNLPQEAKGGGTLSRESMSTDKRDPTGDRTVHVDRYSGRILADLRFGDCWWTGQAMAAGIAPHMGTRGLRSVLANGAFCLAVIFLRLSGVVMWWTRRPVVRERLTGSLADGRVAPWTRSASLMAWFVISSRV